MITIFVPTPKSLSLGWVKYDIPNRLDHYCIKFCWCQEGLGSLHSARCILSHPSDICTIFCYQKSQALMVFFQWLSFSCILKNDIFFIRNGKLISLVDRNQINFSQISKWKNICDCKNSTSKGLFKKVSPLPLSFWKTCEKINYLLCALSRYTDSCGITGGQIITCLITTSIEHKDKHIFSLSTL